MTVARFLELFQQYGLLLLFAVFLMEYMNLPGFPAGVIMPAAGVLVAQSQVSLWTTLLISIIAGTIGSALIYALCFIGGSKFACKFLVKHDKVQQFVLKCQHYIERHGGWGIAVCRLIPVLRTIVSIPAGLLRVPAKLFLSWSALGIGIWNTALISFGYIFSNLFIA